MSTKTADKQRLDRKRNSNQAARESGNSAIVDLFKNVEEFELDDLSAERPLSLVLREQMHWDEEFCSLAISEYKKFMFLSSLHADKMVPAEDVDSVWHCHLTYTRSYQKFCQEILGCGFIHHLPSNLSDGSDDSEELLLENSYRITLDCYRKAFGHEAPEIIWGTRVSS